jgi:hypothetical protein
MSEAIRPYSIAVAPCSSCKNFWITLAMSERPQLRVLRVTGDDMQIAF